VSLGSSYPTLTASVPLGMSGSGVNRVGEEDTPAMIRDHVTLKFDRTSLCFILFVSQVSRTRHPTSRDDLMICTCSVLLNMYLILRELPNLIRN
jgi:hypothetical protein